MTDTLYVLIKRDLYESPGHLGYTGVKDRAGSWPLSLVESLTVPVKEAYDPKCQSSYAIPQHAAPDFTEACYHDLSISHLKKGLAAKDAEIARLREVLQGFANVARDIPKEWNDGQQCVTACGHFRRAAAALQPTSGGEA